MTPQNKVYALARMAKGLLLKAAEIEEQVENDSYKRCRVGDKAAGAPCDWTDPPDFSLAQRLRKAAEVVSEVSR